MTEDPGPRVGDPKSSNEDEQASKSDARTKPLPRWHLRTALKRALAKRPFRPSIDLKDATGVEYLRLKAFIDDGLRDFTWSEIEAVCRHLGLEMRAERRAEPGTRPVAEVRTLEDVLHIVAKLPRAFFRGHEDSSWDLAPAAFRGDGPRSKFKPSYNRERFVATEFRRRAPAILPSVPESDDYLSWLLYMQHYGAATRLLDWTENALVATYFAVASETDRDGQLWVLDPHGLNSRSGIERPDGLGSRRIDGLLTEPFTAKSHLRAGGPKGPARRHRPIAIRPPHLFPRMVAQQSVFTVHPDPAVGESLLEAADSAGLGWYQIPFGCKPWIKKQLGGAGVSRATLFPDLDGLSVGIREASATPPAHGFDPPTELPSSPGRGAR